MASNGHVDATGATAAIKLPHIYSADELMAIKFPPPRWAVPGILAHGFTLLGGMPKFGKSWWMLSTGIAVATGGRAFGQVPVEEGEVLYLALEDDYEGLQERLTMLLPDGRIPPKLHLVNEWPRMGKKVGEHGTTALHQWLGEHPDCRLVMVDTLPAIRPTSGNSRSLYDDDYNTASALKWVADQHKTSLVASLHLSKLKREDPFEQFNATLGLTGGSDAMIVLQAGDGKHEATMHIKGRRVRWQNYAIKWDPQTALWTIVGKAEDYKQSKEREEIKAALLNAGLPLAPREIAQLLGKNQSSVRVLMWKMQQEGSLLAQEGKYTVPGRVATYISQTVNTVNRGNVASVADVAPVAGVVPVAGLGMPCLGCGASLPEGWYVRCPVCEEKQIEEDKVSG